MDSLNLREVEKDKIKLRCCKISQFENCSLKEISSLQSSTF